MASRALLVVRVLAAVVWVSAGQSESLSRSGAAAGPSCDSGKLFLDRDLPAGELHAGCLFGPQLLPDRKLPSIDTVYEPEPAKMLCMDKSISYSHAIPSSGAFRPVGAESGEYLYCPPQRWLNNVRAGAIVFLYHPCARPQERHLLSELGNSCLPDYIITPHPQLSTQRPIALASWGRVLEISAISSSDICEWLQSTSARGNRSHSGRGSVKYNLLLTSPAAVRQPDQPGEVKESVGQCCERVMSVLLGGGASGMTHRRPMRAALTKAGKEVEFRNSSSLSGQQSRVAPERTEEARAERGSVRPSVDKRSPPSLGHTPDPQASNPNGTSGGGVLLKLKLEHSGFDSQQREKRPAAAWKGSFRTPRTDEAAWAAGALGFLLILLTLTVLHTRLYRHWRTTPSLYWHDPQRDYDSVADVIRRRLRIAKGRRKRGRRQESVPLPPSSSSDEDL